MFQSLNFHILPEGWTDPRMDRRRKGKLGEDMAAKFLEERGYVILSRNYRYDRGEIDIVAEQGGEVVFVEVKLRVSDRFGTPEESITPAKEEQLKKVAEGYVREHGNEHQPCRFDVVAISFVDGRPEIRLHQNAIV